MAVHRASPLGEALDPLRLDPPLAWERILPVLRFPSLCRLVAGRLLEIGLEPAGGALVAALLRFSAARDPAGGTATPADIAFAIRFLAHAFWLDQLYGGTSEPSGSSDLVALLATALSFDPRLLWPPDVAPGSALGAAFRARLERLAAEGRPRAPERYALATTLCRFAARAA
jgi:hypothetical protein